MNVIVYTRISLDRTGAGDGVSRQREDALELAQRRGWNVSAVFEDNDISASGMRRRPGFESSLEAIRAGEASVLVAWSLDRLTRNRRDTVRLIETCQAAGAMIALVRGSDMDMSTPSGRLIADVLASVARAEIEVKSDRQRRANLQRAKAGKPHAGRRAYGYSRDGHEVVESEADVIRGGFEALLSGGSLRSIARRWNEAGATSPAGNPWRPDSVRDVLNNPRYAARRYYLGDDMGPGEWPAVVSEDVSIAARAVLSDPTRSTTTQRATRYLLASLAECGRCDNGSKVATARTSAGTRIYKCTARGDLARNAATLDEYVTEVVLARLSAPDAALTFSSATVDLAAIRAELDQQRERQDLAAGLFAGGSISAAQLTTISAESARRVEGLERQVFEASRDNALTGVLAASDVRRAWGALDIKAQRGIVGALFARIVLEPVKRGARLFDPESVRFEWRV